MKWSKPDLQALSTVYDCIDKADIVGLAAETDFKETCATMKQSIPAEKIRDCLQILVQEELVSKLYPTLRMDVMALHISC